MALPELKIFNPAEIDAQIQREKSGQMQNKLAELALGQKQREVEQSNALNDLYKTAVGADGSFDRQKLLTGAAQGGLGSHIPGLQKQFAEQDKAQREGRKSQNELVAESLKRNATTVFANPTFESAVAAVRKFGEETGTDQSAELQKIAAIGNNPDALRQWAAGHSLSADKLLPTYQTRNTGATTDTLSINPVTGKVEVANSVRNTMSPDAVASNNVALSNNKLARERLDYEKSQPKGQVIQTEQGTMLVDPRTGTAQPVTANGQPVQPKLKDLPPTISKSLMENSAALRKIDQALAGIESYPEALGSSNYLGDTIRQHTDPKGIEVRALVADIGSLKLHDRSGAAVTAAETPRLKPFIPSATDSPETVKKKLGLFRQEYASIEDDIRSTYSRDQGYKPPPQTTQKPPAGAATPSGGLTAEEQKELADLRKRLGK